MMNNLNTQKPERVKFRFLSGTNFVELTDSSGNVKIIELEEPEDFITNILEIKAKKYTDKKVIDKTARSWWKREEI